MSQHDTPYPGGTFSTGLPKFNQQNLDYVARMNKYKSLADFEDLSD